MSLSIDQKKINEQLESTKTQYIVTSGNLEPEDIRYEIPSISVGSTTTVIPPDLMRARERLQALRKNLKLIAPFDLDREIDEIRGR